MINHSRDGHIVSDDGVTPTITTRPDELGVAVVDLKRGYPCTVKKNKSLLIKLMLSVIIQSLDLIKHQLLVRMVLLLQLLKITDK